MYALVTGHGDVNDVSAGIQVEVERRGLIQYAVVDRDLRALRLGLDAHNAHAGSVASPEHLLEFPTCRTDFISAPQRFQNQVYIRGLASLGVYRAGFFQIPVSPQCHGVSARS